MTTKRFTGQYHESGLPGGEGLSYYNARWYDAQLGRFVSADTIVPDPANPQALNRLTYVFNNPLNLVDPDGHDPWWIEDRLNSYVPTDSVQTLVAAYYDGSLGDAVRWHVPPPSRRGPNIELPWGPSQSPNDDWVDLGFDWLLQHGPAIRTFDENTHMVKNLQNHPGVYEARDRYFEGERPENGFYHDFGADGYLRAWIELDGTGHLLGSYRTTIIDNGDETAVFRVQNRSGRASFTNLRVPGQSVSIEELVEEGRWGEVVRFKWRTGIFSIFRGRGAPRGRPLRADARPCPYILRRYANCS